jgi:hypothetical protein
MLPRDISLFFAPTEQYVKAKIIRLTPRLADRQIHGAWWAHDDLLPEYDDPIDRHWDWNEMQIEWNGKTLPDLKVAIVTGDRLIQGAMMISRKPVPSALSMGRGALLVELLFTAPWNRPSLRRDKRPFYLAVGTELLVWGAAFSQEKGFDGRIRLDASPEFVGWYEKRGLQILPVNPIVFEGTPYTPMELSDSAAIRLLGQ